MELIKEMDEKLTFNKKEVRLVGTYEEPWFVAKDICEILELGNVTKAMLKIPNEWKGLKEIQSLGGAQNANIINESGLYKLIMRSNKPIAEKFQFWVCGEVLPSLRKKGEYKMNEEYQLKLNAIANEKKKLEEEAENSKKLLIEKDKQIRTLQRETQVVDGINVCYLATTDEKETDGVYIVGKACNLKNRLKAYNNNKLFNFKIIKYISCKTTKVMDSVEQLILSKFNKYKVVSNRDVFQLPKDKDISFFTQWYDYLNKICEDIEDDLVLEDRTEEEKQELIDEIKEECKEDRSIYNREYRESNHEDILDREAHFRTVNKEQLRERVLDYSFNNREKLNENKRKKNAEDEYSKIKKKEYMKKYRKEKAAEIADSKKKYNNSRIEVMEQRIKCACGSTVSRQNMTYHLGTDRHKEYLKTGKTVDELRTTEYVKCICGISISKTGVKRHQKSKLHINFIKSQEKT
jgi:prophage antirepressor-like protein